MPRINSIFPLVVFFGLACVGVGQTGTNASKNTHPVSSIKTAASATDAARLAFDNARTAYRQQRLEEALAGLSEAIRLAPEQPGPWLARSEVHLHRSNDRFNEEVRAIQATQGQANGPVPKPNFWPAQEELQFALDDANQAVELTRDLRLPASELIGSAFYPDFRYAALGSRSDALRVFVILVDPGRAEEAITAVHEFLALEPNETKKTAGTLSLAQLMIQVERPDLALNLYQELLARDASSVEALLGEGVSLIALGIRSGDTTTTQKGMDSLTKFAELAPEDQPFRDSVLEVVNFAASSTGQAQPDESAPDLTGKRPLQGSVLNGKAVSLPKPSFPAVAKFARATGSIKVQVLIDESGQVAKIISAVGHPLLRAAAADAALEAKFTQTTVNGVPQTVTGTIIYNFLKQ